MAHPAFDSLPRLGRVVIPINFSRRAPKSNSRPCLAGLGFNITYYLPVATLWCPPILSSSPVPLPGQLKWVRSYELRCGTTVTSSLISKGVNAAMLKQPSYRIATSADVRKLTALFDAYRQFYECASDLEAARSWLSTNLNQGRSIILVAERDDSELLGFTQLYPALCSVDLVFYYVLYDLYVDQSARRRGLGRGLMCAAEEHARASGAARLDLETARDNFPGQSLYQSLGYVCDEVFLKYSLDLS